MTIKSTLSAVAIAAMMTGGAAMAQNTNIDAGGGKGLVVVDITAQDVAQNIANDLDALNDLDITAQDVVDVGSVQVPINLAAAVCQVEVNAIASSNDRGQKSCNATTTNESLNQAVLQSVNESAS